MDLRKLDRINTELARSKELGVNIEDERVHANIAGYLEVEEKEIKECVLRLTSKPAWVRKMTIEYDYFSNPVDARNFFEDRIKIYQTSMVNEFVPRLVQTGDFHRFEFWLDREDSDLFHKSYTLTLNVHTIEG